MRDNSRIARSVASSSSEVRIRDSKVNHIRKVELDKLSGLPLINKTLDCGFEFK